MQLNPQEIHIWIADLTLSPQEETARFALLNADERARAERFHFALHKRRFIAARSELRKIIGTYLSVAPETIEFIYTEHHKPHLLNTRLQFNLSHSQDIAIFAFTLDDAIGVDIEKIQDSYSIKVAARYFSPQENDYLSHLPDNHRCKEFYRIWATKEALVKAIGKGLSLPFSSFSVPKQEEVASITLENHDWFLIPLAIHPDYQAAVVTQQNIKQIAYLHFFEHGIKLDKISHYQL